MPKVSATFVVDNVAPVEDPLWPTLGETFHRLFWRQVVQITLRVRDESLAKGLDRHGKPFRPISERTRKNRKSAMGPPDPNAPPLTPAYSLSRTRAWLKGRAFADHAEFYWANGWGKILHFHRVGAGRLPVRDAIGVSKQDEVKIRKQARAWYDAWVARERARSRALVGTAKVPKIVYLQPGQVPTAPSRHILVYSTERPPAAAPRRAGPKAPARPPAAAVAKAPRITPSTIPLPVLTAPRLQATAAPVGVLERARAAVTGAVATIQRTATQAVGRLVGATAKAPAAINLPAPRPPVPPAPKPVRPSRPHVRPAGTTAEYQAHLKLVAKEQAPVLAEFAANHGLTVAQYRSRVLGLVTEILDESKAMVRVPSEGVLVRIVQEGRLKNQFETFTSQGSLALDERIGVEAKVLGVSPKIAAIDRPIYGYLAPIQSGASELPILEGYGPITIVLKDGAKKAGTFTGGDSLLENEIVAASSVSRPRVESLALRTPYRNVDPIEILERQRGDVTATADQLGRALHYFEFQSGGRIRAEDIEEVIFPAQPSPKTQQALGEKGIPWRTR